jgi:hypothetical protein
MVKKFIVCAAILGVTSIFLGAAEPSGETLMATAVGPATVLRLVDTPALMAMNTEAPQPVAAASLAVPTIPRLAPSPNFGKGFFDANLVLMVGLNIADYVTTRQALKYAGLEESNPLVKPFVKSPAAFAAVKIGTTALAYWSFKSLFKHNRTVAWIMTTATNALLSVVVANNLNHIHRARAL